MEQDGNIRGRKDRKNTKQNKTAENKLRREYQIKNEGCVMQVK